MANAGAATSAGCADELKAEWHLGLPKRRFSPSQVLPRLLQAYGSHDPATSRPKEDYEHCDALRDFCFRRLNSLGDLSYH